MTAKRLFLLSLFILSLTAFLTKDRWLPGQATIAPAVQKAFFRSEWGMTPEEVTVANGVPLKEKAAGRHFYQAEPGSEARYQSLEAPGRFLGRDAVISYTFLDGRLVSYHVFVSDSDEDMLDTDMRRYLTNTFGPGAEETSGTSLKLVWQTKDRIVNYWLYEELNSLSRPYRAGFGVQDRRSSG